MDWIIETHQTLSSTQSYLKSIVHNKSEGFVVQAMEQTAGYGRHNRKWISQTGNLHISILLKPQCDLSKTGQIAIAAGVSVGQTLSNYIPSDLIKYKWPNDILIANKKCAGLLIESELSTSNKLQYLILGVGINLTHAPDFAISLKDNTQDLPPLNQFRDQFLSCFAKLYGSWKSNGFESIKNLWLSKADQPGRPISIKRGETLLEGYFYGMSEEGGILLKKHDGQIITITAGDIYDASCN